MASACQIRRAHARLPTAVDMVRYRMQSIVNHFAVTFVQGHGPRRGRQKQQNVGKRIKKIHFESEFDSESDDDVIPGSAGIDESREDDGSGSHEEVEAGKRKKKDKGKDKTVASKRPRRGRAGR
jgi:hypothetical protein